MVQIITDSAADLEPREYEKLGVTCIPLRVAFGDAEYRENVDLDKVKFYELLLSSVEFPKTSQASPAVLEGIFADAKAAGDEAIYITLSSALSGTYQTACMIRDDAEYEGAYVFDSRNATGGQRMIVEYACRLRDQGLNAAQIVEGLASMRDRVELYAVVNTLEYLHKGGRISHAVYTGQSGPDQAHHFRGCGGQGDSAGKGHGYAKRHGYAVQAADRPEARRRSPAVCDVHQ